MPKLPTFRLGAKLLVLSILPLLTLLGVGAGFFALDLAMTSLERERSHASASLEKIADINLQMAEMQSLEANLVRYRDTVDDQKLAELSKSTLAATEDLRGLASGGDADWVVNGLHVDLTSYVGLLRALRQEIMAVGVNQDEGLEARIRATAHEIEAILAEQQRTSDAATKLFADEMMIALLMMRRHEKDFTMRGDAAYAVKFGEQVAQFRSLLHLAALPHGTSQSLDMELVSYNDGFLRYVDHLSALRTTSRELNRVRQSLLGQLVELRAWAENSDAASIRAEQSNVGRFRVFLAVMMGAGFVLTLIAAHLVLRTIRGPLLAITNATSALAAGELNTPVPHLDRGDELGMLARFIGGFRNAAVELRDLREQALAAKNAAESVSQRKTIFLANTSHELRSPLNAIIGFSEVLGKGYVGALTAKQAEYVADIEAAGRHLLRIIGDLLDLSKAESDRIELTEEVLDVGTLLRECVDLLEHQGQAKGLSFATMLPREEPRIRGDHLRLKQVLLNLLSNAVKFSHPGGQILIGFAIPAEGDINFHVRDQGVGMTEDQLGKAMELFGQADNQLARNRDGTGLGLPLARRLVELHGGRLEIVSTPGVGTTVTCWLPRERLMPGSSASGVSTA